MLPNVPWYQERRLHQTSLGSLMIIILVRTVKYNLSKLRVRLDAILPAYFSAIFLRHCRVYPSILLNYDDSLSSGLGRLCSKYLVIVSNIYFCPFQYRCDNLQYNRIINFHKFIRLCSSLTFRLQQDIYLQTNCLAILSNMAPYVYRLSAYSSQQLVSLFDMLSRKWVASMLLCCSSLL